MAMSGYSIQVEVDPLACRLAEPQEPSRYERAADEACAEAMRFDCDMSIALTQGQTISAIYAQREAQAARRRARYLRVLASSIVTHAESA